MNKPAAESPSGSMPISLVEAAQLVFLDPKNLQFSGQGLELRLTLKGDRSYLKVSLLRVFPLSEPNQYFSVRDDGKEIGLLTDPAALDEASRRLIHAELERRYLVPVVQRIVTVKERFGTVDWTVETDRGVCRFTTQNLRENIQRPAPGRIILSDVEGNRYDIRQVDDLSRDSQELLYRHL
jgi:hypothetical protein